ALGEDGRAGAFGWICRGVDVTAGAAARIAIPGTGATEQTILLAGGDTIYTPAPLVDAPQGFALAINGALFGAATAGERMRALEALAGIQNPARHDAGDVQCVSCHVATFLTARRAQLAGVDPAALAGAYASPYATAVDSIAGRDDRVLRGIGWASRFPAISQRVANDTAQVLADLERRFPIAREE